MKNFFSKNTTDGSESGSAAEQKQEPQNTLEAKLRESFDTAYYLTRNPDVLASGTDPLEHYLSYGWKENRPPNNWFDPEDYTSRHQDLVGTDTNPFVHFLVTQDYTESDLEEQRLARRKNCVLYWADKYVGTENGLRPVVVSCDVPSQKDLELVMKGFDPEYYLEQNPDLQGKCVDSLLHFMTLGWIELRDPNPDFSVSYYMENNKDIRQQRVNPYLHFLAHGRKDNWRPRATVADAEVFKRFEDGTPLADMVAQAKQLDPMLAMPAGRRQVTSPLKDAHKFTDVAVALRKQLAGKTYKYIVAVPHVRMSGASRVASIFAEALSQVRDASEILVLTTDSSESEYIGWFSDKLDIFDLSEHIAILGPEEKIRTLVDVMRCVKCQTIVNVNSRLLWDAMRVYGRQIHHEFRVITYLFTWDENLKGDRVGYPVQWLHDTAEYHHLLLTDTKNLADYVSSRLGFGHQPEDVQVVPLYTPITTEAATATRKTSRNDAGHFLWAGRFDPQKRVDILVEIARANPHITFDVYGKTVLGKKDLADYNPPDNIIHKGTYTDLQEVLETPYSGFLYTSQWDGLPTILLDMAAAGLPIVASNVGGIAELLDDTTGWLVHDFEDIDGYSAALQDLVSDPSVADVRVKALQTRLAEKFTREDYIQKIEKMVSKHDL